MVSKFACPVWVKEFEKGKHYSRICVFRKNKIVLSYRWGFERFFVILKWRYSCFEFFCFVPPNYLVLMNGQELKICFLMNVSCADSVADVALLGWKWNPTPSPKVENAATAAGHFAYLWLVFPCMFAGQAFHSAPEKVTVRAHETCFILHYQIGSARVVYRKSRQNEWKGCQCYPSSGTVEEDISIFIFSIFQ